LRNNDSNASEAEVDNGSRTQDTESDADFFDSPENTADSTILALQIWINGMILMIFSRWFYIYNLFNKKF
jgi:hypothetical protein